ncbi:tyrosine-type recombinase/integrase [Paenibacillus sp. V4I5]|uniref:tyrosine-type recombinase/integrase n=1 Tax=Paenibacillus sp. V4I5 TaxID=3042306 RepID=UPI0027908094|nr:tyrosine-type recombinase/integrase [Paenibacillus sp. V4I5]MDQ0917551.1 integrase/recombinase XerD [Paenibacillus sp. V4I5]
MERILLNSKYFQTWFKHVELTSKQHVIQELKKFDEFLHVMGYEGELDFNRFHGSLRRSNVFLPIQEKFIDKFVEYLKTEKNSSKYVLYNAITSLKNFFRFLYEMELIETNPMENYRNPFYHRPVKNTALSIDECLALLYAAMKKDPFFRQDFILVWFMLVTGVRNSEVRLLPYENINLSTRMVILNRGQKGTARSTGITEALAVELQRYIGHPLYESWTKNNENPTLFFHKNKPLSAIQLRQKIKQLCIEAGLSRTVTPHDLRRTAGYLMQTSGMHIVEIQRQLGHKILSTTLRYVPPLGELARILMDTEIK